MASELVPFIDDATEIIGIAIYFFAVFRAITIGRGLVNRIYRDRAYLVAALIVSMVAQSFVPDNWVFFGIYAYQITYFALLFFVLVVIDNTILVGLDMDFFHRNTLRWRQTRFIAYAIFLVDTVIILAVINNLIRLPRKGASSLVIISFAAVIIYAAVVLVMTARRTPDRPMRRFLMFAGVLVIGILVSTFINNYTYIDAVDVFDDFLAVGIAYLNYLMVMSLTPMTRIKKETKEPAS
jgi:hypothetical protein